MEWGSLAFDGLWSVLGAQDLQEVLIGWLGEFRGHGVVEIRLVPFQHMAESELQREPVQ